MKYAFIHRHRSVFGVEKMCSVLRLSRSGYYTWVDRPESNRSKDNRLLLSKIRKSHELSKGIYGSPRITDDLHDWGYKVSRVRVARLMQANAIRSKIKRKFKVTTHSDHKLPISPNLLNRNFSASAPNLILVSDITYIRTKEGWLYLTTIMDLFQKKIVGWSMSRTMAAEHTTIPAMQHYLRTYKPAPGVIFHSDRGVQYASTKFRKLLDGNGMVQSMSGKGNCYDNAVAESFFKTLKAELVYHERYLTRAQARSSIFEYIEIFYNRIRKHSALGYLSPVQFELNAITVAA
ncbi:MAG: transposase [Candidatus Marinimicrobia bacterium CG1_02_48_14]|nr:MAG: transposase [Candidatus Marinimicrobia bacterium CG1_02_48_14]